MSQAKPFRGFGLGIMRRLRKPFDETELVIRECRALIRGGVFFDIGANVGRISEAVLPLAKRVVAVEPNPEVFAQLQAKLGAKATCVQALVGPEGEARTFLANPLSSGSSASVPAGAEPKGHDYLARSAMTSVSLDSLAREHGRPDLIKIDVEGAELSVLESGREVLAAKPIVVMEFNTLCLAEYGRINPREAIARILAMFPKVELLTPQGRERVTDGYNFLHQNVLQHRALDNLVCSWNA